MPVPSNRRSARQRPGAADPARPVRPVSLQFRAMLAGDDQGGPGRTAVARTVHFQRHGWSHVLGLNWGFAGGRCWVRTNVGLADGFTDIRRHAPDLRQRTSPDDFPAYSPPAARKVPRGILQAADQPKGPAHGHQLPSEVARHGHHPTITRRRSSDTEELFGWVAIHEGGWERARDVQKALTEAGQHRSAGRLTC